MKSKDVTLECQNCNRNISREIGICDYCLHYLNFDGLQQGDEVIYDPNLRTITYIWDPYEIDCFYPGMKMTIKKIEKQNDNYKVKVNEVEGDFLLMEFRPSSITTIEERKQITRRFIDIWQAEKFPFFKFYKGQKIKYDPSHLTKKWIKERILSINLQNLEIFTIEKTIKRRYLLLKQTNIVYWKDVELI